MEAQQCWIIKGQAAEDATVQDAACNMQIGLYELDAAIVYDLENHELFETWLGLWDPSGEYEGVQG